MTISEQWITGFTDGEGCFHIGISKNENTTLGYQVLLDFVITQHERDEQLLNDIKNYFGVGVVRKSNGRGDILCYRVRAQKHLKEIIIPFFEKNPLRTKKKFAFQRFRQALIFIENKEHLTLEGLQKIRKLRDEMKDYE
jgi:hypothetical protein